MMSFYWSGTLWDPSQSEFQRHRSISRICRAILIERAGIEPRPSLHTAFREHLLCESRRCNERPGEGEAPGPDRPHLVRRDLILSWQEEPGCG